MLVLTRKRDEVIQIGDNIVIKILKTGKGAIKIGIDAPSEIRVTRGELLEEEKISESIDSALSTKQEQALNTQCA
ncbi:carbon storage regulator [uncultured Gimesia sp.]|uniref:carbon storage regulator n=1 Tax=uncultured Gimesia sp. TaxID=1678688 RepID=UPI002631BD18|nr:carbon storage regulator [uncultured Gimesia sp.]